MKKINISPVLIESDLGGIKPKKGQVNYGISMWIKINKMHNRIRSIFHNGSRNNYQTPAIWIHRNQASICFMHLSTSSGCGFESRGFPFELKTWYHWSVSVCGSRIIQYVNGKIVKKINLRDPLRPINDCWLVDPWHGSAEGISISNFCWFPFGISEEFVNSIYLNNPIAKEKEEKEQFEIINMNPNIRWDDYLIFKDIIELKGHPMKKFSISPVQIESDLGGIKPKMDQVNYAISMWFKFNKKSNENRYISIFHNGSRKNHRTPAIWIYPDDNTKIRFIHDSTIQENDGIDLRYYSFRPKTWYHWSVSVCGSQVVHYVNGEFVNKGNLRGEPLRPINDCWLVDPWHKSAEGISISNFCWFPFGISEDFAKSIYLINPIFRKLKLKNKNKKLKKKINPNIRWNDYKIIKKKMYLRDRSMKKFMISNVMIESDLGGIKPIKGQVHYGISMWIYIGELPKYEKKSNKTIFHNGLRSDYQTPAINVYQDSFSKQISIHFRHDSTVQQNDGIDLDKFPFKPYTWYHWAISVCGSRVVHYLNGKFLKKEILEENPSGQSMIVGYLIPCLE